MTEKEFYMWVGNRIRELREKAGMKKVEISEKTGYPDSFLSNVENKGKKISAYAIKCILEAMDYKPEDLYSEEKKSSKLTLSVTPA
jgi:transcriptional regulator with XRE-family HTH domain